MLIRKRRYIAAVLVLVSCGCIAGCSPKIPLYLSQGRGPLRMAEVFDRAGNFYIAKWVLARKGVRADRYGKMFADRIRRARHEILRLQSKLVVGEFPFNRYRYFYQLGFMYELTGRFDEAEKMYRNSLALRPKMNPPYVRLGILAWRKKNLRKAGAMLQKAYNLQPKDPIVIFHYAFILLSVGSHPDGWKQARRLQKKYPDMYWALQYYFDKYRKKSDHSAQ